MELLNILKRLCNNGHLVIITTQALPAKSAELFNQLVLLSDKQVSEKDRSEPLGSFFIATVALYRQLTITTKI